MSRLFDALQKAGLPTGVEPAAPQENGRQLPPEVALPAEAAASLDMGSIPVLPLPHASLGPSPGARAGNGDGLRVRIREQRLPSYSQADSFAAEQFRVLSARLHQVQEMRQLKSILVTSSMFREGKTMISLNLAVTLAKRARRRILLMEFDLRKPNLCHSLGLARLPGLGDWYAGAAESPSRFIYHVADLEFWLFPAGALPAQPLELLQSERLRRLLSQLAGSFDWVVMDSAPLVPMADSNVLARLVDGVLLVVRQDWTSKKLLKRASENLPRERLLGLVLNDADGLNGNQYERYYYTSRTGSNVNESGQKGMPPAVEGQPDPAPPPAVAL